LTIIHVNANITVIDSNFVYGWQSYVKMVVKAMEDFQAAFVERHTDVGALDTTNRRTAAERGKEQGYRFAEIYTYGFRIYRGNRKY
jgi:hypothetical protein